MDLQLTSTEAEEIIDNHWGEIQLLMANAFSKITELMIIEICKAITKRAKASPLYPVEGPR